MRRTSTGPATGVIVTGGASGIGLASARALAEDGRPVALWDLQGHVAETEAKSISAAFGVPALGLAVDLTRPAQYGAAIARSREVLGSLGGLVHAAGIVDTASIEGITEASWAAGIDTHLRPLALLTRDLLPDLAGNPGSAIVAIASINATLGNAMNPIYSAAKGGMLSLVRSLADRLAHDGIRINTVSPGVIRTPMTQPALDHLPAGTFERRVLLGRLGEPEEIGRVVRFLLSEEASYVTAAELVVDGGNISSQRV
ncbi:SDR family oxidoreductase [Altererythrobacter aerius]|uniref:SDR family oxidoreductase n=1 Tax=Tsuneonella aeria TaxID=1837929 RepID=A0A6I4TCS6_9SPHN|nr:SDR family NAD(P)-dependent oxidoreductase [Tsuneonella aeria]MXO75121.1 SDR family oxidoreductase [Tsuneonella aeria]